MEYAQQATLWVGVCYLGPKNAPHAIHKLYCVAGSEAQDADCMLTFVFGQQISCGVEIGGVKGVRHTTKVQGRGKEMKSPTNQCQWGFRNECNGQPAELLGK
jgi:hypothetical protein